MTQFDTRLADRLNELVDHEAGPRPRTVPVFEPSDDDVAPRRSSNRWILSAAVFVLVASLTWAGLSRVMVRPGPAVGAPQSPGQQHTTAPAPVTVSAAPPSGATTASSAASIPPTSTATLLAGMTLRVPSGWVITNPTYEPGSGPLAETVWCLDPESVAGSCTISLSLAGVASKNAIDVDTEGGWMSNPSFCAAERETSPASVSSRLDIADVQIFGGREAEHRRWTHTCSATKVIHVEQYEVAYAPSWILYSELADAMVSSVMASMAASSTLPAQTLPVRLVDKGYVRSVRTTATSYILTIDRYYTDPTSAAGEINNVATTYEYTVAKAVLTKMPTIGDRVVLYGNGRAMTGGYIVS